METRIIPNIYNLCYSKLRGKLNNNYLRLNHDPHSTGYCQQLTLTLFTRKFDVFSPKTKLIASIRFDFPKCKIINKSIS